MMAALATKTTFKPTLPKSFHEVAYISNTLALSVSTVLCLVGNTLVLLSLLRYSNLRTPTNAILGSLAMSDLLMAAPMLIRLYCTAAGDFVGTHVDIQAGMSTTLVANASLHTGLISLDRFISIRYALRYNSIVTMNRIVRLLVLIWSAAFVSVGLVVLLFATVAPNSDALSILLYRRSTTDYDNTAFHPGVIFYKIFAFVLFFCLPVIIVVASYVYVGKIAYAKRRFVHAESARPEPAHPNAKSTKTVFIVVLLYFIFHAPFSVVTVIQSVHMDLNLRYWPTISLGIASLASCCNPYIYAYRDRNFKQAFKKILTCK